jgi:hypothetical protein
MVPQVIPEHQVAAVLRAVRLAHIKMMSELSGRRLEGFAGMPKSPW